MINCQVWYRKKYIGDKDKIYFLLEIGKNLHVGPVRNLAPSLLSLCTIAIPFLYSQMPYNLYESSIKIDTVIAKELNNPFIENRYNFTLIFLIYYSYF